ncbi:MAG: GNAT family N-acetyltransferase, partial [Alphaproteobacteria bacterium]|nr:GNAT family N-acetyltransferase [Alphaproteobacteria bacterium]
IDKGDVILALPHLDLIPSYVESLREGFRRGIVPAKQEHEILEIEKNPQSHLQSLNDQGGMVVTLPSGEQIPKVSYETLWLSCGALFIGEVSFRHELNDFLKKFGGHVGYGIRPSLMNQGLGTLSLKLTRARAARRGLKELLLTCAPDNPASEKIILNNDGVYQDTLADNPFGHGLTKRFLVPVLSEPEEEIP